jgi:hypothetical protein
MGCLYFTSPGISCSAGMTLDSDMDRWHSMNHQRHLFTFCRCWSPKACTLAARLQPNSVTSRDTLVPAVDGGPPAPRTLSVTNGPTNGRPHPPTGRVSTALARLLSGLSTLILLLNWPVV